MGGSREMRRLGLALVIAAAAALALGAGALAHTVKFATFNSFFEMINNTHNDKVLGGLDSEKHACVVGRRVILFHVTGSGPERLGTDRTSYSGHWRFKLGPNGLVASDEYFSRAKRKNIGPPGHHHICKGARSPNNEAPPES